MGLNELPFCDFSNPAMAQTCNAACICLHFCGTDEVWVVGMHVHWGVPVSFRLNVRLQQNEW